MIYYKNKCIDRGTNSDVSNEPIKKWEVWFRIPFGLVQGHEEAVRLCEEANLNPEMTILPVPVAIGTAGIYETFER